MLITEIDTLKKDDDGLAAVIVGWPRRLDGSPTHQTAIVETFARALGAQIAVPVILRTSGCRATRRRGASRAASPTGGNASRSWTPRRPPDPAGLPRRPPAARYGCMKWVKRPLFLLFILVAALAAAGTWWAYQRLIEPYRGYGAAERFVEIPPAPVPAASASRLVDAGVVRDR